MNSDVRHRADQHRKHAGFGKALGGDKGVHAQGQLYEERAYGVNVHITNAIGDGIFAGAEGEQ